MPLLPPSPHREVLLSDAVTGSLLSTPASSTATMYVCGITPYDATHLGHAATYIAFDLLNRIWRDCGHAVCYVQNVTDIDEPLFERADATGEAWQSLAERETALFTEDMTALRVLPPDHFIGAVESIPLVLESIAELQRAGATYMVDDDLYFRVHLDPEYGSRSHMDEATQLRIFAERGGDPDRPGKENRLDPVLWIAQRPGEPSWSSPLGNGRPGWHIECCSIAQHFLKVPTMDVKGGGRDLLFPHHEMSAAQARVIADAPFARTFVHAGMIGLDGEKMSKSKGNLVFVSSLRREGVDPNAIRLALLSSHYRADRDWTSVLLDQALARLAMWRAAVALPAAPDALPMIDQMRRALIDDLNSPRAIQAVDAWADQALDASRESLSDVTGHAGLAARAVDALLGVAL
jgi:L-cysteine:1D-myo-inositol 2-amino-2-deoxy-alpha-D-glucopyranoside ligase